jgi:hypothetical protein
VTSTFSLEPDAMQALETVQNAFSEAEDRHQQNRKRWDRWYAMYRSYRDFKRSYTDARGRRDVDDILRDGQRTFGTQLFIPYCFSVVETTLPRMLSGNPKLNVLPRHPKYEDGAQNVAMMLDAQQERIEYPMVLQDVGKSGLIYGLGIEKTGWEDGAPRDKALVRGTKPDVKWAIGRMEIPDGVFGYDGPTAECVDIYDWLWSPESYGTRPGMTRYVIHRTWPSRREVERNFADGVWELPAGVKLEEVLAGASSTRRDEVTSSRDDAAGYSPNSATARTPAHEQWEFHDGERVITILDRNLPVQAGPLPFWHQELPFHAYRPTRVPHEMCGIGEIEAIQDLQEEMNELRTQRRDNAMLVIQRPFAYFDGLVDAGDIAFGPGIGIPVDGDPRELIFPLPLQDLGATGYQEEARLQADIERVTGLDDTVMGASGEAGTSTGTATGVQLVQAAANVRIQLKTRNIEVEVAAPTAQQFLAMDQQKIETTQFVPGPPKPDEGDREWSWYEIGVEELAGLYAVKVEGKSTQPKNPVQDQQDAQQFHMMFGQDPLIDPTKEREYVLSKWGIPNAAQFLKPQEPQIPLHVLETVAEALAQELGVDPDVMRTDMEELVQGAMGMAQDAQQGGGAPDQSAGPQAAPQQPAPPPPGQ